MRYPSKLSRTSLLFTTCIVLLLQGAPSSADDAAVAEIPASNSPSDDSGRKGNSSDSSRKESEAKSSDKDKKDKDDEKSSAEKREAAKKISRESTGFDVVAAPLFDPKTSSPECVAAMTAMQVAQVHLKFALAEFGNVAAYDSAEWELLRATRHLAEARYSKSADQDQVQALQEALQGLTRQVSEARTVARGTLAGSFPLIRGFGLELVEDEELQVHAYPLANVARRTAVANALTKMVKAAPSDPLDVLILLPGGHSEQPEPASLEAMVESEAPQAFTAAPHLSLFPAEWRSHVDRMPVWDAPDAAFDPICRQFLKSVRRDPNLHGVLVVMLREFSDEGSDSWVQAKSRAYGASALKKADEDPDDLEADKVRMTEGLARDKSRFTLPIIGAIGLLLLIAMTLHATALRRMSSLLRNWQNLIAIPLLGFVIGLVLAPSIVFALGSTMPAPRTDVWLGAWWPCAAGALTLILPAGVFRLAAGSIGRYVPAMSCHGRWGASFVPVALGSSGAWLWAACYALDAGCIPVVIANATAAALLVYCFGRAIDLADAFPIGLSPIVLILALAYGAAAFAGSAVGLASVAALAGVVTAVHAIPARWRAAIPAVVGGATPPPQPSGHGVPRTLEQLTLALQAPIYQPPPVIETLRAALMPRDGEGSLWIGLVGPSAAGKTSAARHLIRELEDSEKELKVLSGRCTEDSTPYQPFREALADIGVPTAFIAARMQGGGMTGVFDRLADEIIPFWDFFSGYRDDDDDEDDEANRGELFTAVTNALHTLSQDHRVVLFLDDVQWIDEGSAALLKHLKESFAPSGDSPPIILLGGRDSATMEQLEMEDAVFSITPPSAAEQMRILEGSLGIQRASARLLVQSMGVLSHEAGGMFWLIRAVQELIANDGLVTTSRGFGLKPHYLQRGQLPVPAAMRAKLVEALRKSAQYRPVLECAALLGEEFRVDDLAECLRSDRLELLQVLRHLDQELQLVRDLPHDQECYAFSSAFILEIVREDLGVGSSPGRPPSKIARELHARIGEVLERRKPRTAELTCRIARHYYKAGGSCAKEALEHCLKAARLARLRRELKEARRFLSMAEHSARRAKCPTEVQHERLLLDAAEAHANGRNVVQAAEAVLKSIVENEQNDRECLAAAVILCRDAARETGDARWSEQLRMLEGRLRKSSQKT